MFLQNMDYMTLYLRIWNHAEGRKEEYRRKLRWKKISSGKTPYKSGDIVKRIRGMGG
jgi:hypothetical protein